MIIHVVLGKVVRDLVIDINFLGGLRYQCGCCTWSVTYSVGFGR